jgi:hypothetical protein
MKNLLTWLREKRLALLLMAVLAQVGTVLAQDAEASSSPAGLAMLVLFLGIAGMIGVLVIRWSQTTGDEEE